MRIKSHLDYGTVLREICSKKWQIFSGGVV
jgi:hypothetical protein